MNKLVLKLGLLLATIFMAVNATSQECTDQPSLFNSSTKEFIKHNDGTVTHLETRLMWKQCLEGKSGNCTEGDLSLLSWQQALESVEEVNTNGGFAGYTDWRLPNVKELESIIEYGCHKPAINLAIFTNMPNTEDLKVWSSTASEIYSGGLHIKSWYAEYEDGSVSWNNANRESQNYAVHLVRGAQ